MNVGDIKCALGALGHFHMRLVVYEFASECHFDVLPAPYQVSCVGNSTHFNYLSFSFRMASKANANIDDPGAFPAREWLRNLCVGKQVAFETR